jgi:hypothetical protein
MEEWEKRLRDWTVVQQSLSAPLKTFKQSIVELLQSLVLIWLKGRVIHRFQSVFQI